MLRLREESQLEKEGTRSCVMAGAGPNRADVTELGAQNKHSRHQGRSHHRDSSVRDKSVESARTLGRFIDSLWHISTPTDHHGHDDVDGGCDENYCG